MRPQSPAHRAGMSLTELLVVIAILGLLAISVVPVLGTTAELRRTQGACRAASSFMAKTQARSIGRSTGSGFRILPINAMSFAADRLVAVDSPEPYRGDTATAAVTITAGTIAQPAVNGDFARLASLSITANDILRFDGRGPSYRISSATPEQITFALRNGALSENLGQSPLNTPWPSPGAHTVEIFRQPIQTGSPLTIPENRAIDLRWSGFGAAGLGVAMSGSFAAGSTVTVLFDGSGRMRQITEVLSSGDTTITTATLPVFFLVGRADRAGQNQQFPLDPNDDTVGANWQYADSWWLAIDPGAGIVKASECNATATTPLESQLFIRQTLTADASVRK